ncbi:MAG: cytochrome c biogenesis protein ResB [Candidatus Brocadiales bacterium]|nr:cytochrome c biogenesis protein ResB [Candidatus Brocadiales bacterium]
MKAETKNDIKQINKGQTNQYERKGSSNKVWDFFCSVKLAVVIILVLVLACIIGTVILQEKTFDEYVARYGYGLSTFFKITQLNNVFYSYWFSVLLVLLCANLICCTIKDGETPFYRPVLFLPT